MAFGVWLQPSHGRSIKFSMRNLTEGKKKATEWNGKGFAQKNKKFVISEMKWELHKEILIEPSMVLPFSTLYFLQS